MCPSNILEKMSKTGEQDKNFSEILMQVTKVARGCTQFVEASDEVLAMVSVARESFMEDMMSGSEQEGIDRLMDLTHGFYEALAIINPDVDEPIMYYQRNPKEPVALIFCKGYVMSVAFDDALYVLGVAVIDEGKDWRFLLTHRDHDTNTFDLVKPSDEQIVTACNRTIESFIAVMLISERYIEIEEAKIPRPERRRMGRCGNNKPTQWRTAKLTRRESSKSEGETTTVEWSHRWMVRPHWRKQWYPSLQQHKLKYIHPYIKGPEDKELVLKPIFFK